MPAASSAAQTRFRLLLIPDGYNPRNWLATAIDARRVPPHFAPMVDLQITRLPRAHEPVLGEEARQATGLSGDLGALVAGAAGSSPYLGGLIHREADWVADALARPNAALSAELARIKTFEDHEIAGGLREIKRRVALLTALADLSGAWPLMRVTGALSDFADQACDAALKTQIARLVRQGKLPGAGEDDIAQAAGHVVIAMGKMGAGELNYSSDIDLVCLFDETRYGSDDFYEVRRAMVRATKGMCATLSDLTGDGYVFRTDLRLRPDPAVTPVCLALEAAERYYESLGRTWERAAYIKARPAAGDTRAGQRFLDALRPFIWRRHLDFATVQEAHDMQLRIRETKGLMRQITIAGHDLKLGRGGIREIEFFTQTRQLIAGGRDESLRGRATLEGLAALAEKDWIQNDVSERLSGHYTYLREAEHRAQMIHDAQTHLVPKGDEDRARMAALMGQDVAAMEADLQSCLQDVHSLTEAFFAPDVAPTQIAETAQLDHTVLSRWPTYPALRSPRAAELFERLKPVLLERLTKADRPDEALRAFDGFLSGLPAGVQVFSLFEANPQLIELLIDIAGTAPDLAAHLSRNASVLDAVIAGDFFAPWPGADALVEDLTAATDREADYEARLVAARRWFKEWHFRIGVHHLRDLIDAREASGQYADLAEAVIAALFPVVSADFATRHGLAPGRGACVLGMGSLGSGRLNARSDLDLIVIYDAKGAETSDGRRPLSTGVYFARLTQALVTALSAPTSEGRLYEVDMRLRPSGRQGPVATSFEAFRRYQAEEAWTWEHLALTRARPIVGDASLCADIEAFRTKLLAAPRASEKVLSDTAAMRNRLKDAKAKTGPLDVKPGPGHWQDLQLFAQAATLIAGAAVRDVDSQLVLAKDVFALSSEEIADLRAIAHSYWTIQAALRLIEGGEGGAVSDTPSGGVAGLLLRGSRFETIPDLIAGVTDMGQRAQRVISRTIGSGEALN